MYRKLSTVGPLLVGVCLLVVRRVFEGEIPTVAAYARSTGISEDSISRAARALRRPALRFLRRRRPGPRRAEANLRDTLQALRARLGPAFPAQLAAASALLPKLLQEIRPDEPHLATPLLEALTALAGPAHPTPPSPPRPRPPHPPYPRRGPGQDDPGDPSLVPVQCLVRQVLGSLRGPHDSRPDVLS